MGQMRNACKILVAQPEGKRQLEGSRPRWDDISKRIINE
jgi:hypothetical protein